MTLEYFNKDEINKFKTIEFQKKDSNNTEYYEVSDTCGGCCGSGHVNWTNYANAVCFTCGGTGVLRYTAKVYTEEYGNKVKARRVAKAEAAKQKRIDEATDHNKEYVTNRGFKNGKGYLVLGNTYPIKEELKNLGAKWNYRYWILPEANDKYASIELLEEESFVKNDYGEYVDFDIKAVDAKVQKYEDEKLADKFKDSEFVGNVGDKLTDIKLTYKSVYSFETAFGGMSIHLFEDEDGHTYKWATSNAVYFTDNDGHTIYPDTGNVVHLKNATIKDHDEYKHQKQTVLTRCKFIA